MKTACNALGTTSIFRFSTYENVLKFLFFIAQPPQHRTREQLGASPRPNNATKTAKLIRVCYTYGYIDMCV
jgi:hypothetical protein